MKIEIIKITDINLMRKACWFTTGGLSANRITLSKMYSCEHSPAVTQHFWIEMEGIPHSASSHLVRHKIGVDHFVQSFRPDRYKEQNSNKLMTLKQFRDRPVNHAMDINALALIHMSHKRLCYNSEHPTVQVMRQLKEDMQKVDGELSRFMVPSCIHLGRCPELIECKYGVENIKKIYDKP